MKYYAFRGFFLTFCLLLLNFTGTVSAQVEERLRVIPFDLADVTLLDGPFKRAMELDKKTLLGYEPDRLLSKFRSEAGLKPKAESYGGWEKESLAGHSLGHYLSACSLMARSSGEKRFLERVQYIVSELEICQQADSDGYIGAMPNGKKVFEKEIAQGNIRVQAFNLNGIWAPLYTQHKVMAGLRDAYRLCNQTKALDIEKRFADWLGRVVENLDPEQIQRVLACEHGGINEVLADLYADTRDNKYLKLSRRFHHRAILDPMAAGKDILPGNHANTQIPKVIGLARRFELTGDIADRKVAEFFWDRVVHHHSYVTGGHGNHEYFGQPDRLRDRLSDETTETCNVYNMLKLSRHLFQWMPRADVADFYERALFNHILASQHPGNGRVVYNLSLEMGGFKAFQDPGEFTCCIGTGMENHAKYGRNIFFKDKSEIYIFQFIAAEVLWREKGLRIRQTTRFPEEQGTTIEIRGNQPQVFTLYIRYPSWAREGVSLWVNGEKRDVTHKPGSYIGLKREWASGDTVRLNMPFSLRIEAMPDDEHRIAFLYGPLVLAGVLGPLNDPHATDTNYVPHLLSEKSQPVLLLKPVQGAVNTFRTVNNVARPHALTLKPFYKIYDHRYSIYWDLFNQASWKQHRMSEQVEQKRQLELERSTLDYFQPGASESEQEHAFKGTAIRTIDFKHRKARVADRGGWFSFIMKVNPNYPMNLVIHYWGGFTGSKTFDILVEGQKIATENISGKKDGHFITVHYEIPLSLSTRKEAVTVRVQPHPGHRGGPLFGVRTIRR